jgi:hypothetical protein
MDARKVIGRSLLAALALGAVFAAQASAAAPEFGRCVKVAKGTGKFSSSHCTVEAAGGSYEWMQGAGATKKLTLVLKAGTTITVETVRGTKITCTGGTGTGEYTGPKTVSLAVRWEGCKTSGGEVESQGQPNGVVVLKPLIGVLGVIKKGTTPVFNKIGLDLSPEEAGGPVGQMHCNGLPIELKGSIISAPLAVNAMKTTSAMKFLEKKGKQSAESFEGLPKDVLEANTNGGPFEQTVLFWETAQTNEEAIEINTVF